MANQTKFIRNPDGSVSEVKEEKPQSPSLSSLAPGYIVADMANNLGTGGASAAANSIAGQAVGSAADGGTLIADGIGGATSTGISPFSISHIGQAGNGILPLAGTLGLYNLSQNRERIGTGKGYLQAGASGAAVGSVAGPVGTGVGFLAGLAANALGIGGKSRTKVEEDRRKQLAEQGINIANPGVKEWELNEKFKESRNEADLVGKDIINSASLWGLQGYKDAEEAKRQAIADKALELGLAREHHGTIDIDTSNADFAKFAQEQLAAQESGGTSQRTQSESPRDRKIRKKAQVDEVLSMGAQPTKSPRYDINLSDIYKNPYL